MEASYPLITTIVASLSLAFIFGYLANRLHLPTLLGYLLAGMVIGPYMPGFVADGRITSQLAEIGIIMLMFGVGLHFSFDHLWKVRNIAIMGGLFQMACATSVGFLFAYLRGYSITSSFIFGLSLSVASTVVMLRAFEQRDSLQTPVGNIAIGWLVVEDIAMVLVIVLLPFFSLLTENKETLDIGFTVAKIGIISLKIFALIVMMLYAGKKLLPGFLLKISKTQSHELMSLATVVIALSFAFLAYWLFEASFALGAFLAGLVLNGSKIGRKAAAQSLPFRHVFSVLFFVSAGMLFNPTILLEETSAVISVVAIIILAKSVAAFIITHLFKQSYTTSFMIAASLAQIGEFSFILAGMGQSLKLLSVEMYDLIIAGAFLSIALNPFVFKLVDKAVLRLKSSEQPSAVSH